MAVIEPRDRFERLSKRQREILFRFLNGQSPKQIGSELGGIKPSGIRTQLGRIYKKLGVADLPQVLRFEKLVRTYLPLFDADIAISSEDETDDELDDDQFNRTEPKIVAVVDEDEQTIRSLQATNASLVPAYRGDLEVPQEKEEIKEPPSWIWWLLASILVIGLMVVAFLAGGGRFQGLFITETPTSTITFTLTASLTPSQTSTPTLTFTPSLTPTRTPTETNTPTSSRTPTETFTPSPTRTQTPRPSPTVDLGDVYELGEWHIEDGMGFRLIRYEIESSSNPDILFLVEVWNQTSQDIHFSWSPLSNSWVIDNLGIRHNERIFNSFQNETVSPQEKILLQILSTSWTTFIDAEFVFQPEITEIYYTLDSLSRLDRASWRITIGK